MGIRKSSLIAVCCFTFFQYSGYTHASLPEACFKSSFDYRIYLMFGDEPVSPPGDKSKYKTAIGSFDAYTYGMQLEANKHGTPQRREIIIKVKDSQSADYITIDASESTTPSGKIQFAWGDPDNPLGTESRISTTVSNKRIGVLTAPLKVTDPVCGISKSMLAPFTVK